MGHRGDSADAVVLEAASAVLSLIRKAKSEHKLSMGAQLPAVAVAGPEPVIAAAELAQRDIAGAGRVELLTLAVGDGELAAEVELPPE